MAPLRGVLTWVGLAIVIAVPLAIAAASPLLQWRDGIYIAASFAGIFALAVLLLQPLLAGGYLPGLSSRRGRMVHRWIGGALVAMVVAHVGGLWLTSAPDVIDALVFNSPTPFSVWGVIAMWATFAAAILAALRSRPGLSMQAWRIGHTLLVVTIVIGSAVHALLIEGIMEPISKAALCALAMIATIKVVLDLRIWMLLRRRSV